MYKFIRLGLYIFFPNHKINAQFKKCRTAFDYGCRTLKFKVGYGM